MAYIRIQVDDDTADRYAKYDVKGAAYAIAAQVERFKEYDPKARAVVFSPEDFERLRKAIGGAESKPSDIVERVERVVAFKAGPAEIQIPPDTLIRAKSNADRRGEDVKTYLERAVLDALRYAVEG